MQIRLWIEYALVALLIATAALGVTVKMQSLRQENQIVSLENKVETATGRIEVIEGVNEAQKQVIQDLAAQRDVDGERIVKLMDRYQSLSLNDRNLRNQLNDLEKNDEARAYLDGGIPDSVGCLYDDTCSPTAAGNKNGTPESFPPAGTPSPLLPPETDPPKVQPGSG